MTAIIGIKCSDGIVIGADSSMSSTDMAGQRIIETNIETKINIIGGKFIIAGAGEIGYNQRFNAVIEKQFKEEKAFKLKEQTDLEIGKLLSGFGNKDFHETHFTQVNYSVLAAYPSKNGPTLCHLIGGQSNFQPEIVTLDGMGYASIGGGQYITDPFLAFFKKLFWQDGPPDLGDGKFATAWALEHICDINAGGISGPIHISVLENAGKGQYNARKLPDDELAEHFDIVDNSKEYFSNFKEVVRGQGTDSKPPKP